MTIKMAQAKYSVNQHLVETLLSWVNSKEIAIPEIQRPFVWSPAKVRDLIDSLYQGYPIGYIIVWRNPNVKLKDGSMSEGKKVLIDGQQRITALTAAILSQEIINDNYKKTHIRISFNPIDEKFEVQNPAILKDIKWIPDIAPIISGDKKVTQAIKEYLEKNKDADSNRIEETIENLKDIMKKQVGLIELGHDLDIETVTDIFVRINNQGVMLKQADFAMSKIASTEKFNGPTIRKAIDYFCHLAKAPEFIKSIEESDDGFKDSKYFQKITWLKNETEDLYDPEYTDLLRVAFTHKFNRGKLADLVSLLSGRNFETRTFEDEIAKKSFEELDAGILDFINETNFKRFLMIVKSAGFISPFLIRSKNVINFAYILYLKLKSVNYQNIESCVSKWMVLCMLTGRYSGSPESKFDFDIKRISEGDFNKFLLDVESAELSQAFWEASLIQSLNTSVASSPYFHVFLASQVKANDLGFLSKDITVRDMIEHRGDIHHLYPKDYLKKNGFSRGQYNQIGNYVYAQQEINIKIGNKSPEVYFNSLVEQVQTQVCKYGSIINEEELKANFEMNCIPVEILEDSSMDYDTFLEKRRILIAKKIEAYYKGL